MKKVKSILVIGFLVISVAASGFIRSDGNPGSQDKVDKTQGNQQQKEGMVEKANYTCSMHPEIVQDKPGKCSKCKMNLVKKEVEKAGYTCPMHPKVLQDKPGKCPECKMTLEKKEPVKKVKSKTI